MNRRAFLGGLLALPVVGAAVALVKPQAEDDDDREAIEALDHPERHEWRPWEDVKRDLAVTEGTASNIFTVTGTTTITSLMAARQNYTLSVAGGPGYALYVQNDQPFTRIRVR